MPVVLRWIMRVIICTTQDRLNVLLAADSRAFIVYVSDYPPRGDSFLWQDRITSTATDSDIFSLDLEVKSLRNLSADHLDTDRYTLLDWYQIRHLFDVSER